MKVLGVTQHPSYLAHYLFVNWPESLMGHGLLGEMPPGLVCGSGQTDWGHALF